MRKQTYAELEAERDRLRRALDWLRTDKHAFTQRSAGIDGIPESKAWRFSLNGLVKQALAATAKEANDA